jgi:Primase C terminal 2 (PriCT-2)/Protein of unknown function (DUF3987)
MMIDNYLDMLRCIDPDLPRADWVRLGAACHAAGISGDDFRAWSSDGDTFDARDYPSQWASFARLGRIGVGTLVQMARDAGYGGLIPSRGLLPVVPPPPARVARGPSVGDVLASCAPATGREDYLASKHIGADGLFVVRPGMGVRQSGISMDGAIVVPIYPVGSVVASSLQFIAQDDQAGIPWADRIGRTKTTLAGHSMVGGHQVGNPECAHTYYYCEGIGAAASAWRATGQPAVACMGVGRVRGVVQAWMLAYPDADHVILPDIGQGRQMDDLAADLGCRCIHLPGDLPDNYDINDFCRDHDWDYTVLDDMLQGVCAPPDISVGCTEGYTDSAGEEHDLTPPGPEEVELAAADYHAQAAVVMSRPPGRAGRMVEWLAKRSYMLLDQAHIMALLGYASAIYADKLVSPTGCGLNLYMCLLAPSTVGKSALKSGILQLARVTSDITRGKGDFLCLDNAASAGAVITLLKSTPSVCLHVPELGVEMKKILGPTGKSGLDRKLLSAYDEGGVDGAASGQINANTEDSKTLSGRVCLTVCGDSTPEEWWQAVSESFANGLVSRFIILPVATHRGVDNEDVRHDALPSDVWVKLNDDLAHAINQRTNKDGYHDNTHPSRVRASDEVMQIFKDFRYFCNDRKYFVREDIRLVATYARHFENAVRIASILACINGESAVGSTPMDFEITPEEARWSVAFVLAGGDACREAIAGGDVGSGDAARCDKIRDVIEKFTKSRLTDPGFDVDTKTITSGFIRKRVRNLSSFYGCRLGLDWAIDNAIKSMIKDGDLVYIGKSRAGGRASDSYNFFI